MIEGGSLARRYARILSVALVGTLLAAAAVELLFSTRENIARAQEYRLSEARAFERRLAFFLEEVERTFNAIAASPWADGVPVAERLRDYQRAMRMLPAVRDVALVDGQGRERLFLSRLDSTRIDSMVQRSDLPAQGAPDKPSFGKVQRYGEQRVPHVTMAIRDRRGDGVSVITLNLQFVGDELARLVQHGGGEAMVLDEAGHLFVHTATSRGGEGLDGAPVGNSGTRWASDGSGALALAVWHALDRPGWKVVVMVPWREALAPVIQTAVRTLVLVAVALVLAVLLGRFMADRMVRPVLVLERGARAIGAGSFDHRIALKTSDELEVLASAFNTMAAQLQDHTSGLERKVEERTAALREALELAREAMRARSLFLAAASHDLRQPLYAISLLADTLSVGDLSQPSAAILEKQREAIGILRSLFDNLLDLSRLEAGEIRPQLRDAALREVLLPLGAQYDALCQSKGLHWECDLPDIRVKTDPELLRRVVGNLLSNAVRYTERGGVALRATRSEGRVAIAVADTGAGIAAGDQSRIFEEFVQLDNVARDREKGVGLGLSIVKRIDELLAMRLQLVSRVGEGTTVTISVPAAPEAAGAGPREGSAPLGIRELAGMRLWIVEDDTLVREALALQLDAWGVDHDFALRRTDLQSLRQADGGWPDAVLLDDMLGVEERGLDLAKWLVDEMSPARIAITTGTPDADVEQFAAETSVAVLRKPLRSADLCAWLTEARGKGASAGSLPIDALAS